MAVLFLCTGNYYRSRYAELRFNQLAEGAGLPLRAASRGLRIDVEQKWNKGPLSRDAAAACVRRGICLPSDLRMPIAATEADLAGAVRVIALKAEEHRPMMAALFPAWAERIEYWDVNDVPPSAAYDPMGEIDALVEGLLEEMRSATWPFVAEPPQDRRASDAVGVTAARCGR